MLDLNHPSHFHFFREFIIEAREREFGVYITARNRKYLPELLEAYDIPYILKGKRKRSLIGKLAGLIKEVLQLYHLGRKIKPDACISFASPYAAIAGKLFGIPVITFDDTENDPLLHMILPQLSDLIITPECFQKSFGKKHLRFKGYKESVYLRALAEEKVTHIKKIPGLDQTEPFIMLRFVSPHSTHELGKKGLKGEEKVKIVNRLKPYGRVYISSEGNLPEALKPFELKSPIDQIHPVLKNAILYFGESTTMAAEAAILGTPAILIEDHGRGYTDDIEKRSGLIRRFPAKEWRQAIEHAKTRLKREERKSSEEESLAEIFSETTDIKKLLFWIIQKPSVNIKHLKHNRNKINDFKSDETLL